MNASPSVPAIKSYYHPVVHLAFGRRLFYLLIRASNNLEEVEKDILRLIEREQLELSACVYVLFGNKDFLIRCWGADEHIRKLTLYLRKIPGVADCRVHLIDDISTWYQKEMDFERPQHDSGSLDGGFFPSFQELAVTATDDDVPAPMRFCSSSPTADAGTTKFFVIGSIVERDFSKSFFSDLVATLSEFTAGELSALCRLSYYSFRGPGRHQCGMIVKAEAQTNAKWPQAILTLVRVLKEKRVRSTTTYVCAKPILENHALLVDTRHFPPLSTRKFELAQNLLMSHGCRRTDFRRRHHAGCRHRAERIAEMLAHDCFDLLHAGPNWDANLRRLRFIYRTVAFGRNAELTSFLMSEFARIEKEVRHYISHSFSPWVRERNENTIQQLAKSLEKLMKSTEDPSSVSTTVNRCVKKAVKKMIGEQPTLSSAESFVRSLANGNCGESATCGCQFQSRPHPAPSGNGASTPNAGVERDAQSDAACCLVKLADAINRCVPHRNSFMHGKADDLFATTDDARDKYVFEDMVLAYMKFLLSWERTLDPLKRHTAKDRNGYDFHDLCFAAAVPAADDLCNGDHNL